MTQGDKLNLEGPCRLAPQCSNAGQRPRPIPPRALITAEGVQTLSKEVVVVRAPTNLFHQGAGPPRMIAAEFIA